MKFAAIITVLSVILGAFSLTDAKEIPSYIKICSRNDPNIGKCVKESIHNMRPYLHDGIPTLKVPAMEPLIIGDMVILEGGPNSLNARVKNLKIFGASNFEIGTLSVSEDVKRFDFSLKLPHLQGFGDYEIDGKLLTLPLSGKGPFKGNFTNFSAAVTVIFDVRPVNDVEKVSIKTLSVKIKPGNGQIRLENLFNGDKLTGDTVNQIINENFRTFVSELIVPIQRALELKFLKVASRIVENFTYEELFPEKSAR